MGTVTHKTWDIDGNLVESVDVEVPVKVIDETTFVAAKTNLKNYWQTFTLDGAPTGTPTAVQNRNAILSLIVGMRYLANEMDNEE